MKYFVYCLYKDDSIIYIGSSTKLLNRLKCHAKDKDFNRVSFCELPSHSDMLDLEIYAIDKIRPPLNKSVPKPRLKEKPEGLKWKGVNLAFLNYDKVDDNCIVACNAHWDYSKYVCDYFNITNIDPHEQYLSYIKLENKVVAVFDGSGFSLEELAISEGLISRAEFETKYFEDRDVIPMAIYEESLRQFD